MNDFTVLHLSDLHISLSGKKLSMLMENLLKDIKEEMIFSENILIVVTGDIVDKAQYQNKDNVLIFFEKLKEILGDRVKHIYIVPGNHDKKRGILDGQILNEQFADSPELKKTLDENTDFYSGLWKYIRMSFDEYTELVDKIYKIFYQKGDGYEVSKRLFKDTYGVQIDKVNGKNVCVLQFNTVWSCTGENDERKIRIGKFQIEQIKKSYREKCEKLPDGEKIDLTIAIAHHPVSWLEGKEEDLIQSELLSNNGVLANVYICGHTHNRDVINWQNNRHSLTTLVSGIGWPDGSTDHPYAHTYSSYVFNLDVNSIDVYVRSSNDAMTFEPDFRIYTQKRNKEDNKIIMPINICKTQAYFKLSSVVNRSSKACYITEEIIRDLNGYVQLLENIRVRMQEGVFRMKYDVLEILGLYAIDNKKYTEKQLYELEEFWFKASTDDSIVLKIRKNDPQIFQMQFSAYLQYICTQINKGIQEFRDGTEVRVHFRQWKVDGDNYIQNCIYGKGADDYEMKPIPWGELLKEAFIRKRPLIASVNEMYCRESMERNRRKENGKWVDFITVIPAFEKNIYVQRDKKTGKINLKRPLLTFGITIYQKKDEVLLYLLDYLRIDKIVGEMIRDFLYYMPVDLKAYIDSNK